MLTFLFMYHVTQDVKNHFYNHELSQEILLWKILEVKGLELYACLDNIQYKFIFQYKKTINIVKNISFS